MIRDVAVWIDRAVVVVLHVELLTVVSSPESACVLQTAPLVELRTAVSHVDVYVVRACRDVQIVEAQHSSARESLTTSDARGPASGGVFTAMYSVSATVDDVRRAQLLATPVRDFSWTW